MRSGLAGERTPQENIDRLIPTIRRDIFYESDQMREAGFDETYKVLERVSPEENAQAIAKFLTIGQDKASEIAKTEHLYSD